MRKLAIAACFFVIFAGCAKVPRKNSNLVPDFKEAGEFKKIHFSVGSYEISPPEMEVVKSNASILESNPSITVLIEGHCDRRGSEAFNLHLGDLRARQVKAAIIKLGIDPDRMGIISYGESVPLDAGSGEMAWRKNRRVEFSR
ncbi:MAG TPA: OmpA family protein [bacterium]|jgi:peptidoglycan-associated lipoprotein|nr:OmpA family protein [Myxococcales bacterium]OQA58708.1 MAG: Outer membrane protein P6 precursor [bacterium ADurb.Bin270]HPW45007.1 OmpA family protein [bacterium]HQC50687.1 OmpA family protein [bacterium]